VVSWEDQNSASSCSEANSGIDLATGRSTSLRLLSMSVIRPPFAGCLAKRSVAVAFATDVGLVLEDFFGFLGIDAVTGEEMILVRLVPIKSKSGPIGHADSPRRRVEV
jgi:hypothetical protein